MKSSSDIESRRLEKRLKERFVKAMATYHLIEDDDRILVGLSGGKDSLLLTELLAKRAKIDHPRFSVEALHVRMENIHYETDTSYLQQFCDALDVKLHIRTTRFETIENGKRRAFSEPIFNFQYSIFNKTKAKAALLSLFLEPPQGNVQSGPGTRLQQDCTRASSGRHHPYHPAEPLLPEPIRHDARPIEDAQDAAHDHSSSVPHS